MVVIHEDVQAFIYNEISINVPPSPHANEHCAHQPPHAEAEAEASVRESRKYRICPPPPGQSGKGGNGEVIAAGGRKGGREERL